MESGGGYDGGGDASWTGGGEQPIWITFRRTAERSSTIHQLYIFISSLQQGNVLPEHLAADAVEPSEESDMAPAAESDNLGLQYWRHYVLLRASRGLGGDGNDDAYANGGFGAVPASSEAIAALPEATVEEKGEKECGVCQEEFEVGDKLRRMPCSHSFHESCAFGWLKVSRLCPYCRFAMPAEMEFDEEEEEDERVVDEDHGEEEADTDDFS